MSTDRNYQWQLLSLDPEELRDARLQVHWAAQIIAATANVLLEKRDDDSQSNLGWRRDQGALVTHALPGVGLAALRLADLTLLLLDENGGVRRELPLAGSTLAQGLTDFGAAVGTELSLRDYDMPEHAVSQGAAFDAPGEAHRELARWYGNAAALLSQLQAEDHRASDLRLWPHHFDIAFLISLPDDASIGVGFLASDSSYAQPYWYVSPWPYPDEPPSALPAAGGHWHTEGFTAAVLTANHLLAERDAASQQQKAESFLRSALGILLP